MEWETTKAVTRCPKCGGEIAELWSGEACLDPECDWWFCY